MNGNLYVTAEKKKKKCDYVTLYVLENCQSDYWLLWCCFVASCFCKSVDVFISLTIHYDVKVYGLQTTQNNKYKHRDRVKFFNQKSPYRNPTKQKKIKQKFVGAKCSVD